MIKVSFDIGGILLKYPEVFKPIIKALNKSDDIEVYVVTDMDKAVALTKLKQHEYLPDYINEKYVYGGDYAEYGENCKKVIHDQLSIDVHVDDHFPYVYESPKVGLFVVPRPNIPYEREQN